MNWALYAIAGLTALGAVLMITQVGKDRKPLTGGMVAVLVAWSAAEAVILVLAARMLS